VRPAPPQCLLAETSEKEARGPPSWGARSPTAAMLHSPPFERDRIQAHEAASER